MTWLNFSQVPPGGWRYVQNDDRGGFLKRFQSYNPYGLLIDDIVAFRKANGLRRANNTDAGQDVEEFMCHEFGGDPRYCVDGSKKNSLWGAIRSKGAAAKRVADALVNGGSTLVDWVGEGMVPIPTGQAQDRADVCTGRLTGQSCPHNNQKVSASWFTGPVAEAISAQMREKTGRQLRVEGEEALHFCQLCLCSLPLKVFVPMQTIQNHFPNRMMEIFQQDAPKNCWVLTESQTPAK